MTEFGVKSGPSSDKSMNDDVPCNSIRGFRICDVLQQLLDETSVHIKKHEMERNEGFSNVPFLNYHR